MTDPVTVAKPLRAQESQVLSKTFLDLPHVESVVDMIGQWHPQHGCLSWRALLWAKLNCLTLQLVERLSESQATRSRSGLIRFALNP